MLTISADPGTNHKLRLGWCKWIEIPAESNEIYCVDHRRALTQMKIMLNSSHTLEAKMVSITAEFNSEISLIFWLYASRGGRCLCLCPDSLGRCNHGLARRIPC
jgi:hypothetical protein